MASDAPPARRSSTHALAAHRLQRPFFHAQALVDTAMLASCSMQRFTAVNHAKISLQQGVDLELRPLHSPTAASQA